MILEGYCKALHENGFLWDALESLTEPWKPLLPNHRHSRYPMWSCGDTISYPVKAWNTGRTLDLLGLRDITVSWAAMFLKFLLFPNGTHRSSMSSSGTCAMAKTTMCRVIFKYYSCNNKGHFLWVRTLGPQVEATCLVVNISSRFLAKKWSSSVLFSSTLRKPFRFDTRTLLHAVDTAKRGFKSVTLCISLWTQMLGNIQIV